DRPKDMSHGDYATNAALVGKVDPHELAAKLNIDGVKKVEVVGKFINFFLSGNTVKDIVHEAHEAEWGSNELAKGYRILLEYTSPNLFKRLHIGNLVGNVLGESLARLCEASGATVKRLNYPSDIGLTVAKGV